MSARKPSFVTLTGADDTTDPYALASLSERFPFVEWAILSSAQRAGSGRYPTDTWIQRLAAACPNINRSLHLCGADVDAFIAGDLHIMRKLAWFDRVQLNFNHKRMPKDLQAIARIGSDIPQRIIIQYNSANMEACHTLAQTMSRVEVLFDASGGRGVSPGSWPTALEGVFCGYAGGIGPDNIAVELERIQQAAGQKAFWIDMEGKLRNDEDQFSLSACEAVLSAI
jgi:hypothetical protein